MNEIQRVAGDQQQQKQQGEQGTSRSTLLLQQQQQQQQNVPSTSGTFTTAKGPSLPTTKHALAAVEQQRRRMTGLPPNAKPKCNTWTMTGQQPKTSLQQHQQQEQSVLQHYSLNTARPSNTTNATTIVEAQRKTQQPRQYTVPIAVGGRSAPFGGVTKRQQQPQQQKQYTDMQKQHRQESSGGGGTAAQYGPTTKTTTMTTTATTTTLVGEAPPPPKIRRKENESGKEAPQIEGLVNQPKMASSSPQQTVQQKQNQRVVIGGRYILTSDDTSPKQLSTANTVRNHLRLAASTNLPAYHGPLCRQCSPH